MTLAASFIAAARSGAFLEVLYQEWPLTSQFSMHMATSDHVKLYITLESVVVLGWLIGRDVSILEFTKEVDSRFKGHRCKCVTLFLILMLTLGISSINTYLSLIIKSTSLTKKPLMVLTTGCTSDDITANKRNKKQMMHWLYVVLGSMSVTISLPFCLPSAIWLISDFRTLNSCMLTSTPLASWLPSPLLYNYLLSNDVSLCTCMRLVFLCLFPFLYISTLAHKLRTPSKFSSVPILVADYLSFPWLVNHDPRELPYLRTPLSPD